MPLQNRVDPLGTIVANPARGLFTGNRGIIHDADTRTLLSRRWTTKAWIICDLVHPLGKKRQPMARNGQGGKAGWTELFFLDEVTALAAGHRPCFYCRREQALSFQRCFGAASAPEMDAILHRQRFASGESLTTFSADDVKRLPDGACVLADEKPMMVRSGELLRWSHSGYAPPINIEELTKYFLVTPPATIEALRNGYYSAWHRDK